ncbi:unnamed protein product [Penicillium roqueforti FM164]|uniref:Genomic scaffold, ProqFM164S02 n=1 Tax=Penicillium roqueforti (strain FM164) TaxID=1365484 RepID=W6QFN6_PENRF|nr:unnamed protein product [Penicillium roqueforti FM164]
MFSEKNIPKALQERLARAISHGFTRDYQDEKEKEGNTYIRTELIVEYKLPTKPRERFLVNGKDIAYLLRHLFINNCHNYIHERARVQTASSLSLFASSGTRAGAIVKSSTYRKSNKCLYYRVIIDPKFLKGWRYRDDTTLIADGTFKGLTTVTKHNFTTLAQRDRFKDQLYIHGIRGGIANKINYPNYKCRDMEQSMSYHRDSNVPLKLNTATTAQFESNDEIIKINQRITHLTQEIARRLEENRDLIFKQDRLYNKKAKRLLT